MQTIGISAKVISPAALRYASDIAEELRGRGYDVLIDDYTRDAFEGTEGPRTLSKPQLAAQSDILITFGGDGTLLSVARHAPSNVPVIGVNMGTLGFLTEIRLDEFPAVLRQVLDGDYLAEARVAFDVEVGNGSPERFRVLNDAVINKSALARMIEIQVKVGGLFVTNFRADGLIVSTPTGSTAYNLSAGGPIIYPTMGATVITPICPHMLSNRPIVLPDSLAIELTVVTENQEIYLTMDGQEGVEVRPNQPVIIRKSEQPVRLVHSRNKNYFDVLRKKLKWGEG